MPTPEALILRRCYPVPVTFADLRAVAVTIGLRPWPSTRQAEHIVGNVYQPRAQVTRAGWTAALKESTGAIDEVYAVIDGREVRVATVLDVVGATGRPVVVPTAYECPVGEVVCDLLDKAERAGYWARPHEVRLDLQERPISRETVAQAVLVGQQYLERSGEGGAA